MRNYLLLVTLGMVFLALSGCGKAPAASVGTGGATSAPLAAGQTAMTATTVPASRPQPIIDLEPCTAAGYVPARCGTLSVYENRAAATGRKIDLKVTVVPARSSGPALDPVFWLAGGPGAAANGDIPFAMTLLGEANQRRDLVFVDQRGTGSSHKLTCKTGPVGGSVEGDARAAEELRSCLLGLDGDPSAYTTAWGMDDLDDVRAALGYDQINLYGASYGPTAAQVYILRHGDHVRTATLTGASLLEVPMFERMPASSQHALELVFTRCETDAACRAAYPNVRAEFAELVARVDSKPIDLPMTDPATGQAMHLTRSRLSAGVHSALNDTRTHAVLPLLIHSLYQGNFGPLVAIANGSGNPDPSNVWQIMNLTILCHEDWAVLRRAETEAHGVGSYMRYADARAVVAPEAICAVMPRPQPEAIYGPLASSLVPVLFLTGEADPQDPEANVAAAKYRYPNSRVLVAPGQAHSYTGISCRASIIEDFIARGTTEGLDSECLANEPLPPFDLGGS